MLDSVIYLTMRLVLATILVAFLLAIILIQVAVWACAALAAPLFKRLRLTNGD